MKSFRHFSRRARDLADDALLRGAVFENDLRIHGECLLHDHQCAVIVHAQRGDVDNHLLVPQRDMDIRMHAQEDALAATPLLTRDDSFYRRVDCGCRYRSGLHRHRDRF